MSSQWVQWSIHKYYADDKDSIKYESLRIPAQPDGHQKVATNRPHTDAQIIDQEGVDGTLDVTSKEWSGMSFFVTNR